MSPLANLWIVSDPQFELTAGVSTPESLTLTSAVFSMVPSPWLVTFVVIVATTSLPALELLQSGGGEADLHGAVRKLLTV